MDFIGHIFGDLHTWLLLGAASFVFGWNTYNRALWDASWKVSRREQKRHPERSWSYDAHDLEEFSDASRSVKVGQVPAPEFQIPALEFYVRSILRGSDIFFAVALAAVTAFVCYRVAIFPMSWRSINWIALLAAAMGILYGVADIAEDLKLASILRAPDESDSLSKVDRAEAAAANMLTRIKMLTLSLSVVGVGIFLVLSALQMPLAKVLEERIRRRQQAAPTTL